MFVVIKLPCLLHMKLHGCQPNMSCLPTAYMYMYLTHTPPPTSPECSSRLPTLLPLCVTRFSDWETVCSAPWTDWTPPPCMASSRPMPSCVASSVCLSRRRCPGWDSANVCVCLCVGFVSSWVTMCPHTVQIRCKVQYKANGVCLLV